MPFSAIVLRKLTVDAGALEEVTQVIFAEEEAFFPQDTDT